MKAENWIPAAVIAQLIYDCIFLSFVKPLRMIVASQKSEWDFSNIWIVVLGLKALLIKFIHLRNKAENSGRPHLMKPSPSAWLNVFVRSVWRSWYHIKSHYGTAGPADTWSPPRCLNIWIHIKPSKTSITSARWSVTAAAQCNVAHRRLMLAYADAISISLSVTFALKRGKMNIITGRESLCCCSGRL